MDKPMKVAKNRRRIKLHKPRVDDFGGAPVAEHDYVCPVCWSKAAVLLLNTGVFHPCDDCREVGWELTRRKFRKGKVTQYERRKEH